MEELGLAGWRVACDRAATRRASDRMPAGAAEACGCAACARFVELRAALLPPELVAALARLGCDPARESELALLARTRGGGFRARAAWRFAGRVLAEPEGGSPFRLVAEEGFAGRVGRVELELEVPPPGPEAI